MLKQYCLLTIILKIMSYSNQSDRSYKTIAEAAGNSTFIPGTFDDVHPSKTKVKNSIKKSSLSPLQKSNAIEDCCSAFASAIRAKKNQYGNSPRSNGK